MKYCFLVLLIYIGFGNLSVFSQTQDDFYNINQVQVIKVSFPSHNWKHQLDSIFLSGDGVTRLKCDVSINGKYYKDAGIRYKGFSSCDVDYVKNPFSINLDYMIKNQNYQGYTKLKLSNVIRDPSFLREVISYEIARKYMPASRANFANVYINDTLIGLYTNVQAVDEKFAEDFFKSHHNSFFKGSPAQLVFPYGDNANLACNHGTDSSGYYPYYSMESEFGWSDLLNLINTLNNDTANLASVLNIDRTLWMHAYNYSILNLDSYIGYSQNYYMYKDDNGRFNPILWDLNMSFGSFRNSDGTNTNLTIQEIKELNPLGILYYTGSSFSSRPLIKNLFVNPTYRRMFLAHMRTIVNENFKNNEYYLRGQEIHNVIDTFVQNDTNKFYSYTYFINNIDTTVGPYANQYPGLKDVITDRIVYLDTFPGFQGAPDISVVNHLPETPNIGQEMWITAKVYYAGSVVLAYRYSSNDVFQRIIMVDDGNHNDSIAGDKIYGAELVPTGHTIQYYIYAENDSAGMFSPERAEYEYYAIQPMIKPEDIVINEFCNDWIEIYNNTNEDFNVKNLFLTDDTQIPAKWAFPDTSIFAKKFLIIKTNNSVISEGIPSNLILNKDSGHIMLSYGNDGFIDSVNFGQQVEGKTIGRYPNGYGPFEYMTPSISNVNFIGTTLDQNFIVYPSPATDLIYIEFENQNSPVNIQIFNADGQTVISKQFTCNYGQIPAVSQPIDISGLCRGIYYIQVIFKDKISIKKLVVC